MTRYIDLVGEREGLVWVEGTKDGRGGGRVRRDAL